MGKEVSASLSCSVWTDIVKNIFAYRYGAEGILHRWEACIFFKGSRSAQFAHPLGIGLTPLCTHDTASRFQIDICTGVS